MNLFQRVASRFTNRGKALAVIDRGMKCANKDEPEVAIGHYSDVIDSLKTPRDVQAMALFNRALVYATTGRENDAKKDLNAILTMPESPAKIKRAANAKLVRMKRKIDRENTAAESQE